MIPPTKLLLPSLLALTTILLASCGEPPSGPPLTYESTTLLELHPALRDVDDLETDYSRILHLAGTLQSIREESLREGVQDLSNLKARIDLMRKDREHLALRATSSIPEDAQKLCRIAADVLEEKLTQKHKDELKIAGDTMKSLEALVKEQEMKVEAGQLKVNELIEKYRIRPESRDETGTAQ